MHVLPTNIFFYKKIKVEEDLAHLAAVKRQKLIPFPRIGKRSKRQALIPFPR